MCFTDVSFIGKEYNGFILLRIDDIPEEKTKALFFRHIKTGLEVYHILKDDKENLFSFIFRTPVTNSKGIPHILEHSTLCGSKKFPLKEPFTTLDNQSVKTYLNALTMQDRTCYPAASVVQSDYFNLFDVYADAVFFPKLSKETFEQEGHRLEIDENGKLSIQGVVYNEMKGEYSSFDSAVVTASLESMFPESTYSFESGGNPKEIPTLTYEEFIDYHKTYYKPSNCLLFLWGNIPTQIQLDFLNENLMPELEKKFSFSESYDDKNLITSVHPLIKKQIKQLYKVNHIKESVYTQKIGPDNGESGCTAGVLWYAGKSRMEKRFLTELLIGNDSSPMSVKLKESNLGEDLSSLCGNLMVNVDESAFGFALSGVKKHDVEKVYRLIFDSLQQIYSDVFSESDINSALMGTEFSLREVIRFSNPNSLNIMSAVSMAWCLGYELDSFLSPIKEFEKVKKNVLENPEYVKSLIKKYFLDNSIYNCICVVPSKKYFKELNTNEEKLLEKLEKTVDKEKLRRELDELHKYQQKTETEEELACIPHLKIEELPVDLNTPVIEETFVKNIQNPDEEISVLLSREETNGVIYIDLLFPFDCLSPQEILDFPLLRSIIGELGWDGKNWKDCTSEVCSVMGDFIPGQLCGSCGTSYQSRENIKKLKYPQIGDRLYLKLSAKFLVERTEKSLDIVKDIITKMQFDDVEHFKTLIKEYKSYVKTNFIGNEGSYLSLRGSADLSVPCAVYELTHGITQFFHTEKYSTKDAEKLLCKMKSMYEKIMDEGCIIHITADSDSMEKVLPLMPQFVQNFKMVKNIRKLDLSEYQKYFYKSDDEKSNDEKSPNREVFKISTNSGCALVNFKSSENFTKEYAAEEILSTWLNGHQLWEKIRMSGGAYGGGCSVNPIRRNFAMRSWRDPSPIKSIQLFEESLKELSQILLSDENIERTIISTYGDSIDVDSPSVRGDTALGRYLYGRTPELVNINIQNMLKVTAKDVQNAAVRLLENFNENHNELVCCDHDYQISGKIIKILL